MRAMNLSSRRKLKPGDAGRFAQAEPALFAELAKVVCEAGMLPQKELHECWQMANAVHKTFPDCLHVADLAAGHGLLAWILVLLARSDENPIARTAVAVDINRPKSADALAAAITNFWPNLLDSVHYVEGSIDAVIADDGPSTLLVAAHACGSLSDRVLLAAISSGNPVAIMPCCHSLRKQAQTLSSLALASALPPHAMDLISSSAAVIGQAASIDQFRIEALKALNYQIIEDSIQAEITGYHRIIMGKPSLPRAQRTKLCHPIPVAEGLVKRLGEIRAFEKLSSLNVANIQEAEALSKRPSREWIRSFDLSYWVDDDETGQSLAIALGFLTQHFQSLPPEAQDEIQTAAGAALEYLSSKAAEFPKSFDDFPDSSITIHDRYIHPTTQRLAFTYRIELRSTTVAISKSDATLLRKNLCCALENLEARMPANFTLRGP